MQSDDRRIVRGCNFDSSPCHQYLRVASGKPEFAQPFKGHRRQQQDRPDHAAAFKEAQFSVNPGPKAVSSVRRGNPVEISRSKTNKAVGDDMFP